VVAGASDHPDHGPLVGGGGGGFATTPFAA